MNRMILAASAMAIAATAFVSSASAREGIELGVLDCRVGAGTGFIIGSTKDVTCVYKPADAKFGPETYVGVIKKFGLDVGVTDAAVMQWVVLAPSANVYAPGALAGNYVGASAEATLAVGAGANLLIGGSSKTYTLQPLSVQAQTGVILAVGVTELQLRKAN